MAESEYQIRRKKGYTVVYREVAQDSRLSLKARGLFLFMQSLPESFTLSQSRLAKLAGVGRDQIRAALKELENVGYLVTEQSHDDSGKFSKSLYILQEDAPGVPPLLGFPTTGKPTTENPTLLDNTIYRETPIAPKGGAECVSAESPDERRAVTSPGRNAPKWKPERFERFWMFYRDNAHGHYGRRAAAVRAWDKLKADDNTLNLMGACLIRQTETDMWRRGVGIPYASTWLNQRYWEDNDNPPDGSPSPSDFMPDDLMGG